VNFSLGFQLKVLIPIDSLCTPRVAGMRGTFAPEDHASQCTRPLALLHSFSPDNLFSLLELPAHFPRYIPKDLRCCDAIDLRVYFAHSP